MPFTPVPNRPDQLFIIPVGKNIVGRIDVYALCRSCAALIVPNRAYKRHWPTICQVTRHTVGPCHWYDQARWAFTSTAMSD